MRLQQAFVLSFDFCPIHCAICFTIMSASLPSKVPVKLSVALVLFFFFLLAASGMFTGWLFSISVAIIQMQANQLKLCRLCQCATVCTTRFSSSTAVLNNRAVVPAGPWERCCLSSEATPFSSIPPQLCPTWPTARELPCNREKEAAWEGGEREGKCESQRDQVVVQQRERTKEYTILPIYSQC